MVEVCWMLPFASLDTPDRFYPVWTSLFLHAGLLYLLITTGNPLCGPVRMAAIYFGSGMAGNLALAILIPHMAGAGPAGAQFGILACLIREVNF